MNEDHAVSIYLMAKAVVLLKSGWKLTGARLKKVDAVGCHIQAILCCGEMCQAQNVLYPFEPPLKDEAELRKRVIEIHNKEIKPKLKWFVTKPMSLVILTMWLFVIWASRIADKEYVREMVGRYFEDLLSFFTSERVLSTTAFVTWFFDFVFGLTLAAHILEALFVALRATKALKLSTDSTIVWLLTALVVGFPFFKELVELVEVKRKSNVLAKKS